MDGTRWLTQGIGIAAVLVFAATASADVAPPRVEDMTCPRGTVATLPEVPADATDPRGRPLRPYPYCAPTTCASDADCDGGATCSEEEIGYCLEEREVAPGQTVRVPRARGCEPDGTCLNIHSTCERVRRCVTGPAESGDAPAPAEEPTADEPAGDEPASDEAADDEPADDEPASGPAASPRSGCSCRAAPGPTPAWVVLLAPLAILLRRR